MRRPDVYTLGVDIGQARDFTAIGALRRVPMWTGETKDDYEPGTLNQRRLYRYEDRFHLGLLERMPLHTPYAAIGTRVGEILHRANATATAVIDQTGVGRPVVEQMQSLPIVPVTITSGQGTNCDYDGWKVGKKVLVSNAQVLLQNGRLVVAKGLPLVEEFVREMLAFKVKLSAAGNQSFEAWREGVHDDLVLAVCLAAWWAARSSTGWISLPPDEKGHPVEAIARHVDEYALAARKKYAVGSR